MIPSAVIQAANSATTKFKQSASAIVTPTGTTVPPKYDGFTYTNQLQPNVLSQYASYNYNLSLSVLDINSFNNSTYKKSGAKGPFLAYSANKDPSNRVETVFGKFDFFIEDLRIGHIVGFEKSTGNTNAISIDFKIIEPYSLGLFFIALQQEAYEKGYTNYLAAPLLLTLEFKGHKNPEDLAVSIPSTTRHFPIRLRNVEMRVSEKGCEYDISAYPSNESAFEQSKVIFSTAVSIKGDTVEKMIKTDSEKSLQLYLNLKEQEQVNAGLKKVPDKFEIEFPNLPDGTVNPIKGSDMGFTLYKGTDTPFAKDNFVYDSAQGIYKRGNIEINPKVSEFKFAQGGDLIAAINQVILMSDYGKTALSNVSDDGFVNWWRIEVNLEVNKTDENLPTTGEKSKTFIYRIIPYRVSSSYLLPNNEKLAGADIDKLFVLKEYNYLYSGNNTEILNFDIHFKNGFYTELPADGSQNTDDRKLQETQGKAADPSKGESGKQVVAGQKIINASEFPSSSEYSTLKTPNDGKGGGGAETAATRAAKTFHAALTSGTDMIKADMTILGDPYYIGDSGVGNYHAPLTNNKYINQDGAMAWDNGEIHIILNFKTPVDINLETGLYDFSRVYKVNQFSGLYRILRGESYFSNGKFTQTLNLARLKGQAAETGSGQLAVDPAEQELQPKFNVNDLLSAGGTTLKSAFNQLNDAAKKLLS